MTNTLKYLASASAVVIAAMGVTPAFAAETASGVVITNTAKIDYKVGGVDQTQLQAVNNITVDRKVKLTVAEVGSATTIVVPGQLSTTPALAAVSTFTITNNSNATIDIGLGLTQLTGGAAPFAGGNDNFNFTNVKIYADTDNSGTYNAGDTLITYLDEVAQDAVKRVFVVVDIPTTQVNGDIAAFSLTGTAKASGTSGTEGTALTATAGGDNVGVVDTVLADVAGSDDAVTDGKHSARDDFKVGAPVLTVAKLSRVIQDPINGAGAGNTSDPLATVPNASAKMIPGAVVEYCITVANGAGGSTATNVAISDVVPPETLYLSAFGVYEGGTVASSVCSGGASTGTYTVGTTTVAGALGSITAGTTKTVYFRVTIK
jgi:uncharacterized repeat protein (TIGR01451 family)